MSSLRLKKLSKSYGDLEILKSIDLDIQDGEFLVLVGPSGCGKSTTLRLIAGLEEVTKGSVYIGDDCVNDRDPSDRDIAMVFQNYALYPQMTVRENMEFGLKIRNISIDKIKSRVEEVAKILKIDELLNRKPKELSGGQRQRVALGRAIVRKPNVFLFDEPLSNLDAKLRQEMRIEIKKLHSLLDTTMVYVTHDQTEAMTMGDRIAVMNKGNIEQLDTAEIIYSRPLNVFTSTFIGTPQINLIEGKLINNESGWLFSSDKLTLHINNEHYQYKKFEEQKVIFGIRPENILIEDSKNNSHNTYNLEIDFIENLGSEMNVHLSYKSKKIISRINYNNSLDSKKSVSVKFDINEGHFFDKITEQIL